MCVCLCSYRVRIAAVNFKGKQLQLEMISPSVSQCAGIESGHNSDFRGWSPLMRLQNQNYTEVIMFTCPSKKACKTLWKSCVEHHTFFR